MNESWNEQYVSKLNEVVGNWPWTQDDFLEALSSTLDTLDTLIEDGKHLDPTWQDNKIVQFNLEKN